MIHELVWALVALSLLGLLLLLGIGKSRNNLIPSGFIGLDEVFEGGLFALAFMLVLLPLYPIYLLLHAVWRWFRPVVPPAPLPVEGDDPVWGRNVNRKLIEAAFRAVQQAWMKRDPDSVRELVGDDIYADLKRECARLTAQHEVNTRHDIQITEINIHDEKIDDDEWYDGTHAINYYLEATISGTMTNYVTSQQDGRITSGSTAPQAFEEKLQFASGPKYVGHWVMVTWTGLPHAEAKRRQRRHHKRKSSSP